MTLLHLGNWHIHKLFDAQDGVAAVEEEPLPKNDDESLGEQSTDAAGAGGGSDRRISTGAVSAGSLAASLRAETGGGGSGSSRRRSVSRGASAGEEDDTSVASASRSSINSAHVGTSAVEHNRQWLAEHVHSDLSSEAAAARLREHGGVGSWIVWQDLYSTDIRLSVLYRTSQNHEFPVAVMHCCIEWISTNGRYRFQGRVYDSVRDVISRFQRNAFINDLCLGDPLLPDQKSIFNGCFSAHMPDGSISMAGSIKDDEDLVEDARVSIEHQPYFHGYISVGEATAIVNRHTQRCGGGVAAASGDFLIRASYGFENHSSVTFFWINAYTHFLDEVLDIRIWHRSLISVGGRAASSSYWLEKDISFTTIDMLLEYYRRAELPDGGCTLGSPIVRGLPAANNEEVSDFIPTNDNDSIGLSESKLGDELEQEFPSMLPLSLAASDRASPTFRVLNRVRQLLILLY